jgi:aldehyde dehydrogenase (NAD+)
MTATSAPSLAFTETGIRQLFEKQIAQAPQVAHTTARQRIEKINRIWTYLEQEANFRALAEAMQKDFRKPSFEVWATEVGVVKAAIMAIRRDLRHWMRDEPVPGPLALAGMSSRIQYEPKGVCLILSPWNYPVNLSIAPLVSAIAAGNTVILKPSEMTPHTAAFMAGMIGELFPPEEVAVVEGDAEAAKALLELPFNHIHFVGSPAVGKIVMAAAAKHLASVTLELGGKSPAIIDETADTAYHAEKLVWAKCMNNGQTCIAPDYAIVHESKMEALLEGIKKSLADLYGADPKNSPDLARIVNDRHFHRIRKLIEDAVSKGARIVAGGQTDEADLYIAPTVLTGVTEEMDILHEEIFGPVLPVVAFRSKEEAVAVIRRRPKPLDMYIGSRSNANIRYFLKNTSAGATVINEYMTSFSNSNLPFGGINNSGMGRSIGRYSFMEFSNQRSVMRRHWLFIGLKVVQPPFSDLKMKLLKLFYRFV